MRLAEVGEGIREMRPGVLGAALALFAVLWLGPQVSRVGITWDEPHYFASAAKIQEWTRRVVAGPDRAGALSEETIREVWDWDHYHNPHPPAYKIAMALTEAVFGRFVGPVQGFRLASVFWFALLVGGVTVLGSAAWGRTAGFAAGVSLLVMPRMAGHAMFAATDMPLSFLWFLGTAGLLLYLTEGRRRHLALGAVGLGLGMATKFTGYFLPVPTIAWVLLFHRDRRSLLRFGLWIAGGLVVAWVANPLAWHAPIGYPIEIVRDSLLRQDVVPINTFYLGRTYGFLVPWHHAPFMTAATLPLAVLVLAGIGLVKTLRRPIDRVGIASAVTILFFWVLLALPSSPNHDGVRLFLPTFPFIALLAGSGFALMGRLVKLRWAGRQAQLATLALGAVFFLPAYLRVMAASPLYLSAYGEAVGGTRGAARAGLEATYWYDSVTPDFLARLNERLPRDASLATFPTWEYFLVLKEYGLLRKDIRVSDAWPSERYLQVARKALFGPAQWRIYGRLDPVLSVSLDGVELTGYYELTPADVRIANGEAQ
ncbi:MAG: ArnT family glycosyltransferase [Gemmatimonadota bacterium]